MSKLSPESALLHRHDFRHHSLAPTRRPDVHNVRRSLTDPLSQPLAQRSQVPWHISDEPSDSRPRIDMFRFPPENNVQHSVSSSTITSVPEQDELDPKSPSILRSLEQADYSCIVSTVPSLHVDTSNRTRVSFSEATPVEISPILGSSTEFSDPQHDSISMEDDRPHRWWPYFLLPEPHVLYFVLFPTINDFRSRGWVQKTLAIIAIPAVFCFTITLPVVDTETTFEKGKVNPLTEPDSSTSLTPTQSRRPSDVRYPLQAQAEDIRVPRVWNRWLTGVQCLFAPLFIIFILFRMIPDCDTDSQEITIRCYQCCML